MPQTIVPIDYATVFHRCCGTDLLSQQEAAEIYAKSEIARTVTNRLMSEEMSDRPAARARVRCDIGLNIVSSVGKLQAAHQRGQKERSAMLIITGS